MDQNNRTIEINRERAAGYMTVILVTKEAAILKFVKKYGSKPEEVKPYEGLSGRQYGWHMGPVQEGGE